MKNIKDEFLKQLKSNKSKILDFIPDFKNYLNKNEVTWDDLLFIKDHLYQAKKSDLLDDFLLEYIKHESYYYASINKLLLYLDHPLSRRVIVNLIKLDIINDKNINSINKDDVTKYYNILNNNYQFDYSKNKIEKFYRNVKCYDSKWFQYHCNQIEKIPVLTEEEELYLFFERDKNVKEAVDYLILSNLRLVRVLATSYAYKIGSNDVDELYQNGVLGLINAVKNYNVYTGIKFSTYATQTISRAIRREHLKDRSIYIPTDIAEGTRIVTDEETQIAVSNATKSIVSLEQEMFDSDDDELVGDYVTADYEQYANNDFLKPVEDYALFNQMLEQTNSLINSVLTEEELNIIKSYFYDEKTQKEIVSLYSLSMTHQNLSLRIKKIIKKLKENEEFKKLFSFISDDYKVKEPKKKMSSKNKNEIIEERKEKNNEIDYREITINRLKREFSLYPFIKETDIEKEVTDADNIIKLKSEIIDTNKKLVNELMNDQQNVSKIIKIVKTCAQHIRASISSKSYAYIFRNEVDFLVSVFDIFEDPKTAKKVDAMEIVYKISEVNRLYDPNTLINYMSTDVNLYLKLAEQVRREKEEGITTTIDLAQNNINSHLYKLVRTAYIGFFKDHDDDCIKMLLKDVLESYQGDLLMFEHIKNVAKEQYEIINGTYEPPVRQTDYDDYEEEIKPGNYSEIEYYGHYMKIWKLIKTDDLNYYNFLVLKFKDLVKFDDLVSMFPNAHQYYADAINYINEDISNTRKNNVKSFTI